MPWKTHAGTVSSPMTRQCCLNGRHGHILVLFWSPPNALAPWGRLLQSCVSRPPLAPACRPPLLLRPRLRRPAPLHPRDCPRFLLWLGTPALISCVRRPFSGKQVYDLDVRRQALLHAKDVPAPQVPPPPLGCHSCGGRVSRTWPAVAQAPALSTTMSDSHAEGANSVEKCLKAAVDLAETCTSMSPRCQMKKRQKKKSLFCLHWACTDLL